MSWRVSDRAQQRAARRPRGRRRAGAARTSSRQKPAITSASHVGRVRVARAVLGVAVQRQVGQHEPEAVGQLLHQRLPLAVREQRRVQQRERRAGARLAVGDPRAVVVVVEPELHGAAADRRVSGAVLRRSPYDREIFRLAVPALGALAAEPLYVLVDTAIVGHLGTTQLASLAIAATVLTTAFTVFNFLTYGTTAQVARLHGAGAERRGRARSARRRSGWRCSSARAARARSPRSRAPLVALMGGEGEVADGATTYLRIAALGAPAFMLASAGQGYLRGIGDLRTPLVILVVAARGQRRARAAVRLRLRLGPGRLGVGHRDRAGSAWAPRSSRCSCAPAGSGPVLARDAAR